MAETVYAFDGATAVNLANDTIDLGVTPPPVGTVVHVRKGAPSSVLPAGMEEDELYYIRAVSGTTCRLAHDYNFDEPRLIDITEYGSGSIEIYTATYTVQSGSWSSPSTWSNGVPLDGDYVQINNQHAVLVDVDMSLWTGLRTIYMDPNDDDYHPTLYFMDGTDGYLKLRAGHKITTVVEDGWDTHIAGRARILANANGNWNNITPLSLTSRATIECVGGGESGGDARIEARCIEMRMFATHPTETYVTPYGERYDVVASPSTVRLTTNAWAVNFGASAPDEGTPVMVRSAGGTLPGGLEEDTLYFISNVSLEGGQYWCGLAHNTSTWSVGRFPLTSHGAGDIVFYTGVPSGASTFDVFEDVSGDDAWSTTTGQNSLVITGYCISGSSGEVARKFRSLSGKTASTVSISAATDWNMSVGSRIWMASRNVEILQTGTPSLSYQYGLLVFGGSLDQGPESYIDCRVGITYDASYGRNYCVGGLRGGTVAGILTGGACGSRGSDNVTGLVLGTKAQSQLTQYLGAAVWSDGGQYCSATIAGCNVAWQGSGYENTQDQITFAGEALGCNYGVSACDSLAVVDGVIRGCLRGVNSAFEARFTGRVTCCESGIRESVIASSGTVDRCRWGYYNPGDSIIGGTLEFCTYGMFAFQSEPTPKLAGLTINRCWTGMYRFEGPVRAYNLVINNCTLEWDTDTSATGSYFRNITSYNHGGIQSSVRVYSTSGAITRYTGAYRHPGQDYTYQFTFYYGNTSPTWVDWELGGLIENTIGIAVFGRNMTTGLRADQRVWWGVFDEAADPWVSAGAEYLAQWVSTDALGWQSSVLEVSRTPGQKLRIRMAAWRNSGNAYGHCYVLGGGGISFGIVGTNLA